MDTPPLRVPPSFVRTLVEEDRNQGLWDGRICTRFPPEPNGHLHLGHAKALLLSYAVAQEFGGIFHLRFDDTNPEKDAQEFVESIEEDVAWMGISWDGLFFASDYFGQLHDYAVELIKKGLAFVDDLSPGEISRHRGSLVEGGQNSPFRGRSVEENLDLFGKMRRGEFEEGQCCLRAKIDMSAPNINMRDPVLYRIRHGDHYRTGKSWCVYPTYDFTHPLSDSLEGITHSLCSLEFEDHRPLYDWLCRSLGVHHPRQMEFARLNLDYTLMGKRHLRELVEGGGPMAGWDDPRLPTLKGLRRRGYTPEAIGDFSFAVGVTKKESVISLSTLEHHGRKDLDRRCERRFVILRPLKVVLVNWDEEEDLKLQVPNHPKDESLGRRTVSFGPHLYIEREDFEVDPPKKYFRLAPGRSVRLKYAYILEYVGHREDGEGRVVEVQCTYRKDSLGGVTPPGMKRPKGIIGWVEAGRALEVEVRLYDRLLKRPRPTGQRMEDNLNPHSLEILTALAEEGVKGARVGEQFQFERQGYFRVDEETGPGSLVFNRTVSLKDTWAKEREGP